MMERIPIIQDPDHPYDPDGYYCVICQRYLEADEYGVIVHDNVPHPDNMRFDEEDKPQ